MYIRNGKCSIEEDSIKDFQDFLESEDEENKDGKDKEEIVVDDPEEDEDDKEDEEENVDEGEDKKGKEREEKDNKKSDKTDLEARVAIPNFKEIIKKYPDFFKDFPQHRHVFFQNKEYRELFPSVEEAKEAAEQLETFSSLQENLASGKSEDVISVLESMKDLGEDVVSNFASNFLDGIKKVDQDLYYSVITPELVKMTRNVFNAGVRNENENLRNAAAVISQHLFGNAKVASGEAEVKLPSKKVEVDDKLEKERLAFKNERYSTFYNDIVSDSDVKLDSLIMSGLDEKISKGLREVIVERTRREISKILGEDKVHASRMNSLWRKAGSDNFTSPHKNKILSAYLEGAKGLIPKVRSKVRSEILGTRDRNSETNAGPAKKRVEPPNNAGGVGSSRKQSNFDNGKKIDYKKTSDLDILNDRVVYKN